MSAPDPDSSAPQSEAEPLLDINGNPIPRNWNPGAVPPPDAEPPAATKKPPSAGNRAPVAGAGSRLAPPGAYQPPPRPAPGGGFTEGHGAMPGEDEVRYDLAGNPLPPMKKKVEVVEPSYSSATSRSSGKGSQRGKSGSSGSPLGIVFAIVLLALIAGAGYVMYTKNQANIKTQASPPAATTPEASGSGSGAKAGGGQASPFGKH